MSGGTGQIGGGKLRLYDVLNFLAGPEGDRVLDRVRADTYALATQRENDPLLFFDDDGGSSKVDPFRVRILEHCYDDHFEAGLKAMPMAVTSALAKAADDNGMLDLSKVETVLGAYAAGVAKDLQQKMQTAKPRELPINTKYETIEQSIVEQIARSLERGYGIERMPLLRELVNLLGAPDSFEGFEMASLSHLFATRPALYNILEECGMTRDKHLVSGKGYSRNIDVVVSMRADGWRVDESLDDPQVNYAKGSHHDDKRAAAVLSKLFEGVKPGDDKKFLLLDDGGNLLVALHKHFPQYAGMCRVVEQTDHGIQRIEREIGVENLLCPVINMARSWLKKQFESPIIGEAVVHSIETSLSDIHPKLRWKGNTASLLGFGAVNEAVASAMERRGYKPENIWVWDKDPEKRARAKELGYQVPDTEDEAQARLEVLRHGFLTITATGQTVLTSDEYDALPDGAIVTNAGSGNHELGFHELDVDQRNVADLPDGRRVTRLIGGQHLRGSSQIETFMNTALDHLELQDGMLGKKMLRTASILGYDDDAKLAIQMLEGKGFKRSDIVVADVVGERLEQAKRDGLRVVDRDHALRQGTIVLTNDENGFEGPKEAALLPKHAIRVHNGRALVEMGQDELDAADRGFGTASMRDVLAGKDSEFFRGHQVNNAARRAGKGYRHRVMRTGSGHEVLALRSGYVINMETGIPPEYVQLILGMLFAGCVQATKEDTPGLKELAHQDVIKSRMERCLKKIGRSLSKPSFRGLRPAF